MCNGTYLTRFPFQIPFISDIFLVCELCSIPIYDTANRPVGPIWMEPWHFPFCWTRSKFSNMRELKCKPGFAVAGHWFSSLFTNFSTTTPASWYIQHDRSTGQGSILSFSKDLNLGKGETCSPRMSWLWCRKHSNSYLSKYTILITFRSYLGRVWSFYKGRDFYPDMIDCHVISSICYCACACKQFPKTINCEGTQPSTFFFKWWDVHCTIVQWTQSQDRYCRSCITCLLSTFTPNNFETFPPLILTSCLQLNFQFEKTLRNEKWKWMCNLTPSNWWHLFDFVVWVDLVR